MPRAEAVLEGKIALNLVIQGSMSCQQLPTIDDITLPAMPQSRKALRRKFASSGREFLEGFAKNLLKRSVTLTSKQARSAARRERDEAEFTNESWNLITYFIFYSFITFYYSDIRFFLCC